MSKTTEAGYRLVYDSAASSVGGWRGEIIDLDTRETIWTSRVCYFQDSASDAVFQWAKTHNLTLKVAN